MLINYLKLLLIVYALLLIAYIPARLTDPDPDPALWRRATWVVFGVAPCGVAGLLLVLEWLR